MVTDYKRNQTLSTVHVHDFVHNYNEVRKYKFSNYKGIHYTAALFQLLTYTVGWSIFIYTSCSNTVQLWLNLEQIQITGPPKITYVWNSGCKESHFKSLPFGKAEASIYYPKRHFNQPQKHFDEQNWFHSSSVIWILQKTSLAHPAS